MISKKKEIVELDQDWVELIRAARDMGISIEKVSQFIKGESMGSHQKNKG